MILIEVVDAAFAIWEALVITIVVGAFVGAVVLLTGLACGTWAVKRAWRVFGPRARCDGCAPAGAPRSPSCGSGATEPPPEASSTRTEPRRSPTWSKA